MTKIKVATENGSDVELHYHDYGTGRPVVLIHGWPLSGRSWENQIPALIARGHRVITYDRRGFGASSQTWNGYDYDTFAADLDTLLRHLDVRDVALVGFSMGGGEVARYIGRYGTERVSKVVFAAAITPFLLKTDDNPRGGLAAEEVAAFQAAVKKDRLAFIDQFMTKFFTSGGVMQVSEAQRHYAATIASSASPKGTYDCIEAFACTDFRADLAKISIPTLVIHGDGDAIVPFEVSGKRTAASIAGAKLVVIKGAPHGMNASHTAEFNQALVEFLA